MLGDLQRGKKGGRQDCERPASKRERERGQRSRSNALFPRFDQEKCGPRKGERRSVSVWCVSLPLCAATSISDGKKGDRDKTGRNLSSFQQGGENDSGDTNPMEKRK